MKPYDRPKASGFRKLMAPITYEELGEVARQLNKNAPVDADTIRSRIIEQRLTLLATLNAKKSTLEPYL